MEQQAFFHICANGDDAKDFILSEQDFFAAFNRVGVCAANSDTEVVVFSIEETHPHFLLFGTRSGCISFTRLYKISTLRYIARTRGNTDGVSLHFEMYPVEDKDYLMNVGTYIVSQPTKDGKTVLPFDYPWGSAPLYFRAGDTVPVWYTYKRVVPKTVRVCDLTRRKRDSILHSKMKVPGEWQVCNDFLLPENYVNTKLFESIYSTHNCYRTFLSSGRNRDAVVISKMASVRGVLLDDFEARRVCRELAKEKFGTCDVRRMPVPDRLSLAGMLRRQYRISFRQLSALTRIHEAEIRKYIR